MEQIIAIATTRSVSCCNESRFGVSFFKLKGKTKTDFKFEFQCSVILKIEKSISFMFYVLNTAEKRKPKLCF